MNIEKAEPPCIDIVSHDRFNIAIVSLPSEVTILGTLYDGFHNSANSDVVAELIDLLQIYRLTLAKKWHVAHTNTERNPDISALLL